MTTQITLEQFASLVREMRSAQDEYFRSGVKTKNQLAHAKALEYRVDKLAKRIPLPPSGQELQQDSSLLNLFS